MPVQTELSIPGEKRISLHSEDLEIFGDGWRTDRKRHCELFDRRFSQSERARIARRVGVRESHKSRAEMIGHFICQSAN
jgi:hypothetical protein